MPSENQKDKYHLFVEDVMNEKIKEYSLAQKINVGGSPKSVSLELSYPDSSENACKLYQAFIKDSSTNETYMSFYSKDKTLFMWYITNMVIVLL